MKKIHTYIVAPEIAFDEAHLLSFLQQKLGQKDGFSHRLLRRSIDARSRQIKVSIEVAIYLNEAPEPLLGYQAPYQQVGQKPAVVVVGAGPAGMFAALRLIELGLKPIVLERGKDVQARRRDLADINKKHLVNPESNYCFGEGGAGTYSDGKLYTRSKKRGSWQRVLEIFVAHGASADILVDAHPHIGTNKLPKIVQAMRESIVQAGGEVHFNTKVTDFILDNSRMKGVQTENGQTFEGIAVLLATGHSARDIFELLHKKGITIEAKPFALGVRIEHSQQAIDQIQYHCADRGPYLPAASYALVSQASLEGREKGVFSFCMCPGGFIVPAATAPGEIVVNGMSPSKRDSQFANSGIVVAVDDEELSGYAKYGPLAALKFQQAIEQRACVAGGGTQTAPAQRVVDFTKKRVSSSLLETSYQPGLASVDLWDVLPLSIAHRLKFGLMSFGKKMNGYFTNDAQIVGVESRTSSPVRIPRNSETLEHPQIQGLFPCGEGPGYAGGIASAAMDGERCAEQIALLYGV